MSRKTKIDVLVDAAPAGMFEPPQTPEMLLLESENIELAQEAFETLDNREKIVIEGRMNGHDLSLIGGKLHLSSERVRQIEMQAVRKLRKAVGTDDD